MHTLQRGSFLAVVVALGVLSLLVPIVGHAQISVYGGQYMYGSAYPYANPYTAYSYPTQSYSTYPVTYPSTYASGYQYGYGTTGACGTISYNIGMGSRLSSDIIRIQDSLRSQGYFNFTSTGVFGQLTKRAVMQYQAAHGLAATGVVNAATWSYLQGASCGSAYIAPTYPVYPDTYQYPYNNYYPQYYNTTAPTISGVDGPTQVQAGQTYNWTVRASDTSYAYYNGYNQGLSTTVTWGDEGYWGYGYGNQYPATMATYASSQTSFSHTYYRRGVYNATFTVTNANGKVASYVTTISVY